MFFHILFRVHTYIPPYQCFFPFLLFSILWSVNFVDCFHFMCIFFSNSHYYNRFSQFLQIFFVTTVRKITTKNHCSVQNFFCFPTLDLFALTVHVIFPFPPQGSSHHTHRHGRTGTYTGSLTFLSEAC